MGHRQNPTPARASPVGGSRPVLRNPNPSVSGVEGDGLYVKQPAEVLLAIEENNGALGRLTALDSKGRAVRLAPPRLQP